MRYEPCCKISDDWAYKGMKVIFLENECLRIGILAGRGSDIFEFKYKPFDLDFLLRLPSKLFGYGRRDMVHWIFHGGDNVTRLL